MPSSPPKRNTRRPPMVDGKHTVRKRGKNKTASVSTLSSILAPVESLLILRHPAGEA